MDFDIEVTVEDAHSRREAETALLAEQRLLAEVITDELMGAVTSLHERLMIYDPTVTPKQFSCYFRAALADDVLRAVRTYSEARAWNIYQRKAYAPFRPVFPAQRVLAELAGLGQVPVGTMELVARRMHQLDALPIVGPIRDGMLIPDRTAIETWGAARERPAK